MNIRRISLLISVIMVLALVVGACAPTSTGQSPTVVKETIVVEKEKVVTPTAAPEGQVTISFWHAYNADVEAKFLEQTIIPAFEAQYPNIKVQAVLVPYDQFRRKLLIALSGGTAPDVARVDIIWVPELADQGALAKLDETMTDFDTLKEQLLPGPLSTNFFQGHYYGLPLDTNTRVLVYNKALFAAAGIEKPPSTIDELLTTCEKIKQLGTDKYCFADGGTYAWAVNPWIWSFGGDITDPQITKASGYVNSPETAAAYQFLKDGVDKGYIHPGIKGGGVDAWGGFAKDEIAMLLEGPWFPPLFGSQFPDKDYGLALMPAGKGGSISVVGGEDIVIFQQSQHKEAAAEFVRYMLSEETQLKWVETGQMLVLKNAEDSEVIKNHPFFGIFLEQLKTAKARTPHPAWARMEEKLTNAGQAILAGEGTVQENLNRLATELESLLVSSQ